MKKIIILFLCSISVMAAQAQNVTPKIEVDVSLELEKVDREIALLKPLGLDDPNVQKCLDSLNHVRHNLQTILKSGGKKYYTTRKHQALGNVGNEVRIETMREHLYNAGSDIRIAHSMELFSVGLGVVSGICFASANNENRGAKAIGIITGAASLGCGIASLVFHFHSGKELKLAADKVIYSF